MIVVAIVAGIVTLALLFKPFFGNLDGFLECLRFWFTPDIFSWFRGEWREDWWAELKLGAWIGCGVLVGLGVHAGLGKVFG